MDTLLGMLGHRINEAVKKVRRQCIPTVLDSGLQLGYCRGIKVPKLSLDDTPKILDGGKVRGVPRPVGYVLYPTISKPLLDKLGSMAWGTVLLQNTCLLTRRACKPDL